MQIFKVDGGRYGGKDHRTGKCDTCDAESVPLISIDAAEDHSSTGVCESCVHRMFTAFSADRGSPSEQAVPLTEFRNVYESRAWDRFAAAALSGFNAYGFADRDNLHFIEDMDSVKSAAEQADALILLRRQRNTK